ncbi:MAG: 16S rRNA (uracil(1498)-N(3))-methyltransferase [Chlamydiales bacterium]
MRKYRCYHPEKLEGEITLLPTEAKHLQVLRVRDGDKVEVVDGKGSIAEGIFQNKVIEITSSKHFPEPKPKIILAATLIKQSRLEWLIEKGTELGTHAFWLFPSDHSERKNISSNHLTRLEAAALSAFKQCKRLYLPQIQLLDKMPKPQREGVFGDLRENAPPLQTAKEDTTVYIGPEGGFSEKEHAQLEKMANGARLGRHVLRAETAAIAALSTLAGT